MDANNKPITVTSPLLPSLEDFYTLLKDIWERKWLTNNGTYITPKTWRRNCVNTSRCTHLSLFTKRDIAAHPSPASLTHHR